MKIIIFHLTPSVFPITVIAKVALPDILLGLWDYRAPHFHSLCQCYTHNHYSWLLLFFVFFFCFTYRAWRAFRRFLNTHLCVFHTIHFFVLKLQFRKELLLKILSCCDKVMQGFLWQSKRMLWIWLSHVWLKHYLCFIYKCLLLITAPQSKIHQYCCSIWDFCYRLIMLWYFL